MVAARDGNMFERPPSHTGATFGTTTGDAQSGPEDAALIPGVSPGQDVVAMIVHELRGPLATMSGVLEIYRTDPNSVARPPVREILARQVQKALRLVDDLLDVSRLARDVPPLAMGPVDLSQVINYAVEDLEHEIRNRQQALILDLAPETIRVQGDGMRLGQIVANLLENGSKYSGVGARITLSLARAGSQAVLCIRDSGTGIPAEDLPHIFDPYYRGNHSAALDGSGLGLGLTLTRRLIELHGGTIDAKSDGAGCGSEFTVRLPALAASHDAP